MFSKVIQDIQKKEDRAVFRALTKAAGIPKMEISIHKCSFGSVLIGSNDSRVKAIEFGKDADDCYRNFINRWSSFSIVVEDRINNNIVDNVLKVIETGIPDASIKVSLYEPGTYLQRKVWEVISTIESGKTMSYKDIAIQIGHPKAFRAVGTACGANPIAVMCPVIG